MGMIRSILILLLHSVLIVAQAAGDFPGIDSLPPCGKTCVLNALASAQKFGCADQDTACICASPNFSYGIRDCSHQSCPPSVDFSSIISVVDLTCAQASGASSSTTTLSTAASSSTVARSVSTSSSSTVGPIHTPGLGGTFGSAVPSTTVERTPPSSSLPTGTESSSAGPNPSRPSSTTPSAAPSPVSSGLTASAKVGVGLGVPLGVIVCIALGSLVFRYMKHKQRSRLRHHGNVAAAGLYPAVDESADAAESSGGVKELKPDEGERGEEKGPHEMHGGEVPAYSRELPGSPGPARSELNARRGSV